MDGHSCEANGPNGGVTSERTRTQSLESHWSLGKELDRKMVEMINDYPDLPTQNMGLRF